MLHSFCWFFVFFEILADFFKVFFAKLSNQIRGLNKNLFVFRNSFVPTQKSITVTESFRIINLCLQMGHNSIMFAFFQNL